MRYVLMGLLAIAALAGADRPNIVIIMADDMGYSDVGCYGGEIETPVLDDLAARGMRFRQFYNNAKCAPTRASLLTGQYSQAVGCHDGPAVMEDCVTIAEVLGTAGYGTYMAGKWHAQELPTDRGFDRYFGLADGCCNFFNPGKPREGEPAPAEKNFPRKFSRDGNVMQPFTPEDMDFYTTDAFTDAAVSYLQDHDAEQPFFLYLAYTAPHYPLQAPEEDIAKYEGKYLKGWDALRAERYARMVDMGIIDPAWKLSPRDPEVAPWDQIGEKDAWDAAVFGRGDNSLPWKDASSAAYWDRAMATYAAMVDRMDRNIGRVVDQVRAMGQEENTLFLFLSDNGACAEVRHQTPDVPPGPVNSYRTVDAPWANAQNTPYRRYKRWDHEGGIATPLIAFWPGTVPAGKITDEVGHIIDFMATAADLAGATYPEAHGGEKVSPPDGKSLVPVLKGGTREGHDTICWQFSDARAVRQGDWKLVQAGRAPWELYNLKTDRTELNNLADAQPERVAAMKVAYMAWAQRVGARQ
jgi:arylsulfatase